MPPRQIGDEYPLCPQATESGGITLVFFSLDQYSPCSRCHVNLHSKVPHRHATEANWGRISCPQATESGGITLVFFSLDQYSPCSRCHVNLHSKVPHRHATEANWGRISFMSPSDRIGGNYSRVFLLRSVFPLLPMPCKFAFKGPPSTCHRGKLGTISFDVPKRQNRGELLSCFSP